MTRRQHSDGTQVCGGIFATMEGEGSRWSEQRTKLNCFTSSSSKASEPPSKKSGGGGFLMHAWMTSELELDPEPACPPARQSRGPCLIYAERDEKRDDRSLILGWPRGSPFALAATLLVLSSRPASCSFLPVSPSSLHSSPPSALPPSLTRSLP